MNVWEVWRHSSGIMVKTCVVAGGPEEVGWGGGGQLEVGI